MCVISQLLLTKFWPNFKGRSLEPSWTNVAPQTHFRREKEFRHQKNFKKKKFRAKKNFLQKRIFAKQNFEKENFAKKKILKKKNFGPQKNLLRKCCYKKILTKKIFAKIKNFAKNFLDEILFSSNRKTLAEIFFWQIFFCRNLFFTTKFFG